MLMRINTHIHFRIEKSNGAFGSKIEPLGQHGFIVSLYMLSFYKKIQVLQDISIYPALNYVSTRKILALTLFGEPSFTFAYVNVHLHCHSRHISIDNHFLFEDTSLSIKLAEVLLRNVPIMLLVLEFFLQYTIGFALEVHTTYPDKRSLEICYFRSRMMQVN